MRKSVPRKALHVQEQACEADRVRHGARSCAVRTKNFFRPAKRKALGPPKVMRHADDSLPGTEPTGVHQLLLHDDTKPGSGHRSRTIQCTRCPARAVTLGAWHPLVA